MYTSPGYRPLISYTVMQVSNGYAIVTGILQADPCEDTAVGVEQADEVVGAMLGCGIEVKYERPPGKDHFLDAGPEYENEVFWAFMRKHLK